MRNPQITKKGTQKSTQKKAENLPKQFSFGMLPVVDQKEKMNGVKPGMQQRNQVKEKLTFQKNIHSKFNETKSSLTIIPGALKNQSGYINEEIRPMMSIMKAPPPAGPASKTPVAYELPLDEEEEKY